MLSATGVGKVLATSLADVGLPVIALSYVISCGMRIAQGSATVAIVTTTGIVAPVVADLDYSQPQLALIVMSIAAGASPTSLSLWPDSAEAGAAWRTLASRTQMTRPRRMPRP